MKTPSDGWDTDEREVLESDELGRQLEAVRAGTLRPTMKHACSRVQRRLASNRHAPVVPGAGDSSLRPQASS